MKIFSAKYLVIGVLATLLAGCATPYRENSLFNRLMVGPGGYTQRPAADGGIFVAFHANDRTTNLTMQTYWLYRAAEITLENGFQYFEVAEQVTLSTNYSSEVTETKVGHFFNELVAAKGVIYIPIYQPYVPPKPLKFFSGSIQLKKTPFIHAEPKSFDAAMLKKALEPIMAKEKCESGNICEHERPYLKPLVAGKPSA
jgi:hypothetical protein